MAIKGFFNDYHYLSNFHPCEVHYEGLIYTSSEAAYQSAKTLDMETREMFTMMDAGESKHKGRELESNFTLFRQDWHQIKYNIMFDIVTDKFNRNKELKQKLINTKNEYLEETNTWSDITWGVCNEIGTNWLGKILMEVRNNLIINGNK